MDYPAGLVGKGYEDFWTFRGRYRVVKGSRASKKSRTAALWFMTHLGEYPEANLLVVRKVARTLRSSCFAELKWAVARLGLEDVWRSTESPLEMTNRVTGQKIIFRGLDDPLKVTSIAVSSGALCWLWVEEAYEIGREEDFDMLDECLRGGGGNVFKQVTVTFNPWSERHWLKRRFFDREDPQVLAKTVNYTCNEWLDKADLRLFERMKISNPRRYRVAGLGEWGVAEGLIYENWREEDFTLEEMSSRFRVKSAIGLDFGYSADPTALCVAYLDPGERRLFVTGELYRTGLSNRRIWEEICRLGCEGERIRADSAEPKSIDELRSLGLRRIEPARKGPDSVNNGIQFLQDLEIIVRPVCVNFITEISSYTWDRDEFGRMLNRPAGRDDHLMDAMRYGCERFISGDDWLL